MKGRMEEPMEELVPIVAELARKYTGYESTSLSYEKAQQLMGAVLYCIREAQAEETWEMSAEPARESCGGPEKWREEEVRLASEPMPARQAYEEGLLRVKRKVEAAGKLYREIMADFDDYGNRCLQDTVARGLPEFFQWYDIKFQPQNTLLTLDYPVLRDLSGYTGIDRIWEFLTCIRLEQMFLSPFPPGYVESVLSRYDGGYRDMIENVCEIVLTGVLGHVLAGKPLAGEQGEEDCGRIQKLLFGAGAPDVRRLLEQSVEEVVNQYYGGNARLLEYLRCSVHGICVRMKHGAEQGTLWRGIT